MIAVWALRYLFMHDITHGSIHPGNVLAIPRKAKAGGSGYVFKLCVAFYTWNFSIFTKFLELFSRSV